MRTNPVRTEMRCRKAKRADRHAGCVNRRRVLRDTSQHATRMTRILQRGSSFDEADCKPGTGTRRMYTTVSWNRSTLVRTLPDTSSAYCAAQILGGLFYTWMYLCRGAHGCARATLPRSGQECPSRRSSAEMPPTSAFWGPIVAASRQPPVPAPPGQPTPRGGHPG